MGKKKRAANGLIHYEAFLELHGQQEYRDLGTNTMRSMFSDSSVWTEGWVEREKPPIQSLEKSPSAMAYLEALRQGGVDRRMLDSALSHMYFLGNFKRYGMRTFSLTENLGRIFSDMHCDYPSELLKVPYQCIYVNFPRIESTKMVSSKTGLVTSTAAGAYLMLDDVNNNVNIMVVTQYTEADFNRTFEDELNEPWDENSIDGLGGNISLDKGLNIEDMINAFIEEITPGRKSDKYRKQQVACLVSCFRMAVHTLLYATSTNTKQYEVRPPKRSIVVSPREYRRNFDSIESEARRIDLGRDIQVLAPGPVGGHGGGSTKTGRSINARFMVRGHYSHYWYLKENVSDDDPVISVSEDGRKVMLRKFLEPFWKGPDTAQKVLRDYVVA